MSTITLADKFSRCDDFASRVDGLYLPDEAWAVFAELDEPTTGEQIAARTQLPIEAVLEALNQLTEQKLVRKQLTSWRDFLAKKGVSTPSSPSRPMTDALAAGRPGAALAGWPKPDAPVADTEVSIVSAATPPAAEPVADVAPAAAPVREAAPEPVLFTDFKLPAKPLHEVKTETAEEASPAAVPSAATVVPEETIPAPVAITTPVAPAPVRSEAPAPAPAVAAARSSTAAETVLPVAFTITNDKARIERKAAAAMTITFRISAPAKETPSAWRLRPLLQAIEQKGGGGLPGQLLVYRVFIHVPADLMHAAGIQSISLVDDNVVIRDRAFYDSLCQAAHAVASIDLRAVKA